MAKMPTELANMLMEWHTVPMATVGEDGRPNVSPKSTMVRDDETLLFTELFFRRTYENLQSNPVASICVWQHDPPYLAYRVFGRIEMQESGAIVEEMKERMRSGHPGMFLPRGDNLVAYIFHVEEIYDVTPSPAAGGKRIA